MASMSVFPESYENVLGTIPWIVYVWVAMIVGGCAVSLFRWSRRRRVQGWPTAQGTIESASVRPKTGLFFPSVRDWSAAYIASLAYSFRHEGQLYSGQCEREFGSEEEGREFVRDLDGKTVLVSYSPRSPAKSILTEEAISILHNARPPVPEGATSGVPVSSIPDWMRSILRPFAALSAIGFGLSLGVHLEALAGHCPPSFSWGLHVGIFVVWFPAVLVSMKQFGMTRRRDFWKIVLRASPVWVRYLVYASFVYNVVNFVLFIPQVPAKGAMGNTPAIVWRGFSGLWMAFYSAAFAILYSAAVAPTRSAAQSHQAVR